MLELRSVDSPLGRNSPTIRRSTRAQQTVFAFSALLSIASYGLVVSEARQAWWSLVNDFLAFKHGFELPAQLRAHLLTLLGSDPSSAWLYRPLPDLMDGILALLVGDSPGTWHLILLAARLLSLSGLALFLVRLEIGSRAAWLGVVYFAFFPAIPELRLGYCETWLMLSLALSLVGFSLVREGPPPASRRAALAMASLGVVGVSLSKEVAAPLTLGLATALACRARSTSPRGWYFWAVPALASVVQLHRLLLATQETYATGSSPAGFPEAVSRAWGNLVWMARTLLFVDTNLLPISALLATLLLTGVWGLFKRARAGELWLVLLVAGGGAGALAPLLVAPYQSLRYLYPLAPFVAIVVAIGLRTAMSIRHVSSSAQVGWCLLAIAIPAVGGPVLLAQAVSLRTSTCSDRALLQTVVQRWNRGETIVLERHADWERGFWIRAEVEGLDARWAAIRAFDASVNGSGEAQWPLVGRTGLNRTGNVASGAGGRFLYLPAKARDEIPAASTFVPALPSPWATPESYSKIGLVSVLEPCLRSSLEAPLARFRANVRRLRRGFNYPFDLGSTPFPGHDWFLVQARTAPGTPGPGEG